MAQTLVLEECPGCASCSPDAAGCEELVAATAAATTTEVRFDCEAGYANWRKGWSAEKAAWCCEHSSRGCAAPTPPAAGYDCDVGYNHWEYGWSPGKAAWCCEHEHRGCTTTSTPVSFDCDAGYADWQAGWSILKSTWCCEHTGRGCAAAGVMLTTSPPFDCSAGYANWHRAWSASKRDWCCEHSHRGCSTTTTTPEARGCSGPGCPALPRKVLAPAEWTPKPAAGPAAPLRTQAGASYVTRSLDQPPPWHRQVPGSPWGTSPLLMIVAVFVCMTIFIAVGVTRSLHAAPQGSGSMVRVMRREAYSELSEDVIPAQGAV